MEGFFATSNGSCPDTTIGLRRCPYRRVACAVCRSDSVATTSAERRRRRCLRLGDPARRGQSQWPVNSASGEGSTSSLQTTLWGRIRSRCALWSKGGHARETHDIPRALRCNSYGNCRGLLFGMGRRPLYVTGRESGRVFHGHTDSARNADESTETARQTCLRGFAPMI
jgi:hypothetical protein